MNIKNENNEKFYIKNIKKLKNNKILNNIK